VLTKEEKVEPTKDSIESAGERNRFIDGNLFRAVLLFFGYLGTQFVLQPRWLTSGGMAAENATVFFATTADGFQLSDLVVLDSGYLPTFLHLVAAILALPNLPASAMGYVYNWAGLVIASLPVIAFQMPAFRNLIERDSNRSVVIVIILAFQSYYSTSHFLNSSYSMIFLLFVVGLQLAVSAIASERKSQRASLSLPTWLLWVAPMLVFTKPATLAIIPLFFYLLFLLKGRERFSAATVVAAGLSQVIVLANSRFRNSVYEQGSDFDLASQTVNVFAYFIAFPYRVLAGPAWTDVLLGKWWSGNVVGQWWSENNISLIFGALIIFGAVFLARKSNNLVAKMFIWVSLALMLSASLLNNFTLWDSWNPGFYLYDAVPLHSRTLTMYVFTLGLFVGIVIALYARLDEAKVHSRTRHWLTRVSPKTLLIVWIIGSGWALYIPLFADEPRWPAYGSSNWATSPVDSKGKFTDRCIVIEPWAWGVYGEGCRVAERSDHSEYTKSNLTKGSIDFLAAATTYPEDLLTVVGFNIQSVAHTSVSYSLTISNKWTPGKKVINGQVQTDEVGTTIVVNLPDAIRIGQIREIEISVDGAVLYTKADGSSPKQILSFLISRTG
jgi:hypothetical protein